MKKKIERFAKWLLKKVEDSTAKEIAVSMEAKAKESNKVINSYFLRAMGNGDIEQTPLFVFADGTEVFQIKIAQANYEMLLMATQEIPQQYANFGMTKQKLCNYVDLACDQLDQAKYLIVTDAVECQDFITYSQNLIKSLMSDFAFGSDLRRNLEVFACYLVTNQQNPYIYDHEEKENLVMRILQEKERLLPFLYAQPLSNLLNTSLDLQEDLQIASEVRASMKPYQEMKLKSLTISDILSLRKDGKKSPWIMTELEILTSLAELNTGT